MGLFSRSNSSPIPNPGVPVGPHLGLDPSFCVDQTTVLKIQTRMIRSGVEVKDSNGNVVVLCRGKTFDRTKEIHHPTLGKLLFKLETQSSGSIHGIDAFGKKLFEITPLITANTRFSIQVTDPSTGEPADELILNASDRANARATISVGEQTIASIVHEQLMMASAPYMMTIASGVDVALMAALCICYDGVIRTKRGAPDGSMGAMT